MIYTIDFIFSKSGEYLSIFLNKVLDSRFSPESIEKAIECSNSDDPNQEAIDFLNEWTQDPSSLLTALCIIQKSQSDISRFISSSMMKSNIPVYWNRLDGNQQKEIRDKLFSIIYSADLDERISYNLISTLCSIALFSWPNEYASFSGIFTIQNDTNAKITLKILSTFLSSIDTSKFIAHVHRNKLRDYIISNYQEKIMTIISTYIENPDLSNDILTIYNCIIRWGSIDDVINVELFEQIINQLLLNEITCEKTVDCLTSIFLTRSDSKISFGKLAPILIEVLSKGIFPNQQPVTSNFHVIEFVVTFLKTYTTSIEISLVYDQIKETKESLITESIELFVQTMQEHGIDSTILHDDIVRLSQIILSESSEEIVDNVLFLYVSLWNDIIRNIHTEEVKKQPVRPTSELYLSLFNEIRQTLFNILAFISEDEESNDNQYFLESILNSIYIINTDDFFEFLKSQPLSPQFCYCLGAFEIINDMSKIENVVLIIDELLQNASNCESPEIQKAMLFGISHCGSYFQSNHQLFAQYIEFIFNSLSDNNKSVSSAAARAFKFLVDYHYDLFEFDYDFIIKSIVEQSETFILNLEAKAAKDVFQSCANLIKGKEKEKESENSEKTNEYKQKMFMKLFEPILNIVSNIDQFPQEKVETALDIISKSCHKSDKKMKTLFNDLYDSESVADYLFYDHFLSKESLNILFSPLTNLAANAIPNENFTSSFIEHLLISISIIQSSFSYEEIAPQIDEMFNLMKSRGKIEDSFFKYFSLIRNSFEQLDSIYSNIHNELVNPYLSSDEPCIELFEMIKSFSSKVIDIGSLTEMTVQSIKELDSNVADAAIKMYQSMMMSLSKEQKIEFLNEIAPQLIQVLIDSIVNLNQQSLFSSLIEFLRNIFMLNYSEDKNLNKMFKQVIVASLNEISKEPKEDYFKEFASGLLYDKDSTFNFANLFMNFLIFLKKWSPCDYIVYFYGAKLRVQPNNDTKDEDDNSEDEDDE